MLLIFNPRKLKNINITILFDISDLAEDAPVLELDEIINLDTTKLQTETTGEKIVAEIQAWLLTKASSQETAVLPEDKLQRLLVGVSVIPTDNKHGFLSRMLYFLTLFLTGF